VPRWFKRIWESATLITWASLVLRTATGLVVVPLIVTRLKTPEIAVWYLFSSVMGLQPLLELGFTPTFVRAVAYAAGGATKLLPGRNRESGSNQGSQESQEFLDRICATMRWLYTRLAFAAITTVALGGTLALERSIAQTESPPEAWAAWAIILVGSFVGFRNLSCSAYLEGSNQISRLGRTQIAGALAGAILSSGVLLVGGGLAMLALSYQVCNIAASEWNRLVCRRSRPGGFAVPSPRPDRSFLSTVWPPTWRSGLGIAMSYGVVQLSAIAYAQLGTPAQVAALLFSLRILQMLLTACQAPFSTKIPLLARLHAQGNTAGLLRVAARGMALSYWVYVTGTIVVGLTLQPFLSAIHSHVAFIDTRLWYAIALAYMVERYGAMHIQLYSLSNDIIWHRANGIAGGIYLIVLVSAFHALGLYAFPTAVLAGYLGFYSWYSAWHSYRWYHLTFWRLDGTTALIPGAVLITFVVLSACGWPHSLAGRLHVPV